MFFTRLLAVAALAAALSGCAGSISKPTELQALTVDKTALKIADIDANAADGVQMSDGDFGLICQKVRGYIEAERPGILSATGGQKMTIHFTRFDRGNAFARAMLIGLGQIKIEATVTITDTTGAKVGEYTVAKDFAIGGMIGATTTVEDVEDGFAKSVAEIVK
jgi:hypothetical protein